MLYKGGFRPAVITLRSQLNFAFLASCDFFYLVLSEGKFWCLGSAGVTLIVSPELISANGKRCWVYLGQWQRSSLLSPDSLPCGCIETYWTMNSSVVCLQIMSESEDLKMLKTLFIPHNSDLSDIRVYTNCLPLCGPGGSLCSGNLVFANFLVHLLK